MPDPLPPQTRRLLLEKNLGFTGAVNRGVRESSSEYIFLLNNDVELAPDCLRILLDRLAGEPRSAAAGGKLLKATDHSLLDGAGDAMLLGGGSYRLGHGSPDTGSFDSNRALACCGAALLVRRAAFERLGGLDERFFAYLDDIDLALRARLAGFDIAYASEARAYHLGSATLGEPLHPRVFEWVTRNQIFLLLKDYPLALLFRLFPRIAIFQVLWFLRALREHKITAWLRGAFGALRQAIPTFRSRNRIQNSRRMSTQELLQALRSSEAQVAAWQLSLPVGKRSRLLSIYFGLFGWPNQRSVAETVPLR